MHHPCLFLQIGIEEQDLADAQAFAALSKNLNIPAGTQYALVDPDAEEVPGG